MVKPSILDLRLTLPYSEKRAQEGERAPPKPVTLEELGVTPDELLRALLALKSGEFGAAAEISRLYNSKKTQRSAPRCGARTKKGVLCTNFATPGFDLCARHRRQRIRATQRLIAEKRNAAGGGSKKS